MKRTAVVKIGLLTLLSVAVFVVVIVWLRGNTLTGGAPYSVRFLDVDGMREGAPVQVMGIRVGFVDRVEPEIVHDKYYVRVDFNIQESGIEIPNGSILSIQQSGLIGEKLLEITPPQRQEAVVFTLNSDPNPPVPVVGMPVKFLYQEGLLTVGKVEEVETLPVLPDTPISKTTRYQLVYRIQKPGSLLPKEPVHHLELNGKGKPFLKVIPSRFLTHHEKPPMAPDEDLVFTIENPLRMKEFLEIQLDSAEALRITNEKISHLLSDDTIATLTSTLENVEILTARATDILDSTEVLLQTTNRDLDLLVQASHDLTENITAVSKNLNDVIGNDEFKSDMLSTMNAIEESTQTLNTVIQDSDLEETLALTQDASKSITEIAQLIEGTVKDKDFQQRLNHSTVLLNESLEKLNRTLDSLEEITHDDDDTLKSTIGDTKETAENMRKFSEKLNKRFLLFRLLF